MIKYVVVIPARLKSTRLPNKPILKIKGKPLIYWTWKNCVKAFNAKKVYVATDDDQIKTICNEFNINVIMTSAKCKTGTDRIAEASKNRFKDHLIINVQGDEPFIKSSDLKKFLIFAKKNPHRVSNSFTKIINKKQYFSTNVPKVILNNKNKLIYMSRSPVPKSKKDIFNKSHKQICVYSFPYKILCKYYGLNKIKTKNEKIEDIEILRLIDNGENVSMLELNDNIVSVDTKKDFMKAKKIFSKQYFKQNLKQ